MATLGSKSNLKKVTRKAILDVDVPKACIKIIDPAAPLALRLQGSLLYGILRALEDLSNAFLVMVSPESTTNNARMCWPIRRASAKN